MSGIPAGCGGKARAAGGRGILGLAGLLLAGCLLVAAGWWLCVPRPPLLDGISFSTPVLDRDGSLLRLSLSEDHKYRLRVHLEDIAPEFIEATLLYEDRLFHEHAGVNPGALLRAAWSTFSGGRRMGASTITMQLARLRYGLKTDTISGKLRQIERALAIERHYSKAEILEAYCNLAPYGGNIEGIGAAARIYFQTSARNLTLTECLSLVGVPQNPTHRNPLKAREQEPEAIAAARARLSRIWLEAHPEDKDNAFFHSLPLTVHSPADLPFAAPHVSVEALRLAHASGSTGKAVRTTIDQRAQKLVERHIASFVSRRARDGLDNACALLVHWPSMEVRALAGSADFHNPRILGQVDGTTARRSPGSTLKPFIYALALDQGLIHPRTLLHDSPRDFKGYSPANADGRFRGPVSAEDALAQSRNIPAIMLANQLRDPDLYDFLQLARAELPAGRDEYGLSLVLGGAEMRPRDLAALYAMLANKGLWQRLVLFPDAPKEADAGQQSRLLSPEASALTLHMLRDRASELRARHLSGAAPRLPVYWKSGTSNGHRDAWAAGVYGDYVLVVWVGNFDGQANPALLGASTAGEILFNIAEAMEIAENLVDTPLAHMHELKLVRAKVCADTGDINTSLCPETTFSWYIPGVSPIADSGIYRSILVDIDTGLRACIEKPGKTRRETWAFWPTDLQRMFRQAGQARKTPPPYAPECFNQENAPDFLSGRAPAIVSPRENIIYHRSVAHPERGKLALSADADADVQTLFWYHGKKFIGRTAPAETLFWVPPGGKGLLRVV
ncbi:penicillin-binding protein 1C, partial [Desulfovibrio sp. OttesenSCG-928-A18]|nr:penicillin-binding protein 1C [Desulfovibrio sp. OttesenSCG-928-A18]